MKTQFLKEFVGNEDSPYIDKQVNNFIDKLTDHDTIVTVDYKTIDASFDGEFATFGTVLLMLERDEKNSKGKDKNKRKLRVKEFLGTPAAPSADKLIYQFVSENNHKLRVLDVKYSPLYITSVDDEGEYSTLVSSGLIIYEEYS